MTAQHMASTVDEKVCECTASVVLILHIINIPILHIYIYVYIYIHIVFGGATISFFVYIDRVVKLSGDCPLFILFQCQYIAVSTCHLLEPAWFHVQ